jgi:hypothetical protein
MHSQTLIPAKLRQGNMLTCRGTSQAPRQLYHHFLQLGVVAPSRGEPGTHGTITVCRGSLFSLPLASNTIRQPVRTTMGSLKLGSSPRTGKQGVAVT